MGGDAIPVIKKRRLSFCFTLYLSTCWVKELGDGENFLSFCYGASNYGIIKRIVNILRINYAEI